MFPGSVSSSKEINFASRLLDSTAGNRIPFSTAVHPATNNIYLYGYANGGPLNHVIAKYNKYGIFQWQKNYVSNGVGFKSEFTVGVDENLYFSDKFTYSGLTGQPHTLFKMDQSGTVTWARFFYQSSSDTSCIPTSTVASPDNSSIYTAGHIGNYAYFVKYDLSGNPLVQRKITGSTILNSHMCADGELGIFIVIGEASGMTLLKYSSDGTLIWQRKLLGLIPYDITCDLSGNPHIAAYRYDPDPADTSMALNGEGYLVKYNSSGTLQWQKLIKLSPQGDYDTSFFSGVRVGKNGDVYANLVATDYFYYPPNSLSANAGTSYPALMKFNSSGVYQWGRNYQISDSGNNSSIGNKISIDENDNIYMATTMNILVNPMFSNAGYGLIKFTPKIEINDVSISLYNTASLQLNKDGLGYYTYTALNGGQVETTASLVSSDAGFTHGSGTGLQGAFVNNSITELFNKKI